MRGKGRRPRFSAGASHKCVHKKYLVGLTGVVCVRAYVYVCLREREREREREIVRASSRTPVPTRAPCAFIPNVVLLTVSTGKDTYTSDAVSAQTAARRFS